MLNKTIANYAHDYRDIAMNEFDLAVMLERFLGEYETEELRTMGDDMEEAFAVKSSKATEEEILESNRQCQHND